MADDLQETGTGIALPPLGTANVDLKNLDTALETLFTMGADPEMRARCRVVAEERFSLASGVAAYSDIYEQLADRST